MVGLPCGEGQHDPASLGSRKSPVLADQPSLSYCFPTETRSLWRGEWCFPLLLALACGLQPLKMHKALL